MPAQPMLAPDQRDQVVDVLRSLPWELILVAFLAGVLRVPVAILQLTGVMAADAPRWYVSFQGLLGVLQLVQ
jgi:hypothetical protein